MAYLFTSVRSCGSYSPLLGRGSGFLGLALGGVGGLHRMGVAMPRHGASRASSAAGGFPLLLVADEGVHQPTEEGDENSADEYGENMVLKPDKHGNFLLSETVWWGVTMLQIWVYR